MKALSTLSSSSGSLLVGQTLEEFTLLETQYGIRIVAGVKWRPSREANVIGIAFVTSGRYHTVNGFCRCIGRCIEGTPEHSRAALHLRRALS